MKTKDEILAEIKNGRESQCMDGRDYDSFRQKAHDFSRGMNGAIFN